MPTIEDFSKKEDFLKYLSSLDLDNLSPNILDELTRFLEKEVIEKARVDFYTYVLLMGPLLVDGFETGRHIEVISGELQDLAERMWGKTGLTPKKMISMAPGGMKSQLCTRLFPSWVLGRWPSARIIIVGHGVAFATDEFGAKVRDILRMEEYQKIFPGTELREDKQTAGRFLTKDRGELVCTSLDAKIAGRRAHLIITDDALVEEDAMSKTVRQGLVKRYMPNIRSRLLTKPDGAELMVGTRWCQGDLFDYLEKEDKHSGAPWKIIKLPALLDEEASKFLRREGDPDDYLVPDTSFWPEFQPTVKLLSVRASYVNNISRWNATYMQNPTPEDGVLLSPKDFQLWPHEAPPECHTILVVADTAYTKGTQSDYSAYQCWGIFHRKEISDGQATLQQHAILLDAKKGKWDYPELVSLFTNLYNTKRPDYFVIESQSSGLALIPDLRKRGIPVYDWKAPGGKDKYLRMQAAKPIVTSGIIWIPMPSKDARVCQNSSEWISEVCMFPAGDHDDVADAFSQFVLFARDNNLLLAQGYDTEGWSEEEMDDDDYYEAGSISYTSALLNKH